jgi:hypothetical protein
LNELLDLTERSFEKWAARNTSNKKLITNNQSAVRLNKENRIMGSLPRSTGIKNTAKKGVIKIAALIFEL